MLCLLHCAEAPRWQLHHWINMHRPVMHKEDISIAEILQLSNRKGKDVDCHKYEIFRTLCKSLNLSAWCLLWGQQKPRQSTRLQDSVGNSNNDRNSNIYIILYYCIIIIIIIIIIILYYIILYYIILYYMKLKVELRSSKTT